MPDEEKTQTGWPSEPTLEMITESFSRHDVKDTPSPRIETGEKKN